MGGAGDRHEQAEPGEGTGDPSTDRVVDGDEAAEHQQDAKDDREVDWDPNSAVGDDSGHPHRVVLRRDRMNEIPEPTQDGTHDGRGASDPEHPARLIRSLMHPHHLFGDAARAGSDRPNVLRAGPPGIRPPAPARDVPMVDNAQAGVPQARDETIPRSASDAFSCPSENALALVDAPMMPKTRSTSSPERSVMRNGRKRIRVMHHWQEVLTRYTDRVDWDPDGIDLEPSPKPAPGSLRLVQSFVNSLDIEENRDEWSTIDELERWCRARRLPEYDHDLSDSDLESTIRIRESLRALLYARCDGPATGEAAATLNAAVASARVGARFHADGTSSFESAAPTAGVIGVVVAITLQSMADGTWSRLKVCRNDTCRWCFYDRSKNGSGRWCAAELCGNQHRARTYRARARARRKEELAARNVEDEAH